MQSIGSPWGGVIVNMENNLELCLTKKQLFIKVFPTMKTLVPRTVNSCHLVRLKDVKNHAFCCVSVLSIMNGEQMAATLKAQ